MTQPLQLTGLIPPMITPLTESGEIDRPGIDQLVNYLIDGGVSGIFVLGSCGEGPWLTPEQSQIVIKQTVQAANGRVPILAGVLEPGTSRTVAAAKQAADAGADAIVAAAPYYFAAGAVAQLAHFETIANHATIPVVVYNIPPRTHNPISLETMQKLLDIDRIVGVKDSDGNWEHFEGLLALRKQRPDFVVMQGAESLATQSIRAGADGLVAGLGNLAPRLFVDIIAHARSGDEETTKALQDRANALWKLHTYSHWLVCLKYAASLLGFGSGRTCDLLEVLSPQAKSAIDNLVKMYGDGEHQ